LTEFGERISTGYCAIDAGYGNNINVPTGARTKETQVFRGISKKTAK
jgi:hypothetical protein